MNPEVQTNKRRKDRNLTLIEAIFCSEASLSPLIPDSFESVSVWIDFFAIFYEIKLNQIESKLMIYFILFPRDTNEK